MDFNKVVETRRSIRSYRAEPVPWDKLQRILEAARLAPSWANRQCTTIMVLTDPEARKAVAAAFPESNPIRMAVETAPVCIVACADPTASGDIAGKPYYMLDVGIALEHLVLAATNEGLGTCWSGWFDEERARKALAVPKDLRVVAILPLGYPDERPKPSPRKPLSELVFLNKWGEPFTGH